MNVRVEKNFDLLEKVTIPVQPTVRNYRVSAMITIGNTIVSFGHCKMKSHPMQKRFCSNDEAIFLHAEIESIVNALREYHVDDLKKATLHVLRLKQSGNKLVRTIAKPCKGCQGAIEAFGFKRVYYTTDEGIESL